MGCPNRSTEVLGGMWTVGAQSIFKLSKGKNIIGQPNSYILAKKRNVAAFCHCPKNLPETKLKSFRSMSLAKEISRQPGSDR